MVVRDDTLQQPEELNVDQKGLSSETLSPEDMAQLYETSLALAQQQDFQSMLEIIIHRALTMLEADGGGVWLWRPEDAELELIFTLQQGDRSLSGRRLKGDVGLVGKAFTTGETVVVEDYQKWALHLQPFVDAGFHAVLAVPMEWQGEVLGVWVVTDSREGRTFSPLDQHRAEMLANQAAVFLQNAKLYERTQTALEEARTREVQLQTAAEVSRAAVSILNPDELLQQVVELIQQRFDLYYVGIFLIDEAGEFAVLQSGTGAAGRSMLMEEHRLAIGGESMIGSCVATGEARIALDVGEEAVRFDNPHLPRTHSEMALPFIVRGEVIGAMTIQSDQTAAFSDEDIIALQTMADQLAASIANAGLYREAQARLEDLQRLQRQLTGEAWGDYSRQHEVLGYSYDLNEVHPLEALPSVPELPELSQGQVVAHRGTDGSALFAPIVLHDQPVGVLGFEEPGDERSWSEDDLALVDTVRQQLALTLENRLLFEQTAEALAETSDLYKIGQQISEAQDVQAIVEAASEGVQGRGELDGMIVGLMGPLGKPEAFRVLSSWDRRGEGLEEGREMSLEAWSDFHEVLEQGGRFVATDVNSASSSERLTRFLRENVDFQGLVGLPLRVRDEHYGTVVVYTSQPHEWMDEELRFYETVARNVSVALENLVLLQHAREEAERRALLNEVMQTASSSLNTIDLLHNVGLLVAKRLEMPTMLLRWDGEYAEPVAIHRPDASEHRLEESVYFHGWEMPGVGAAIRRRESILWHYDGTTAGAAEFQKILDELHVEDAVAAPLMVRNEVLGVLFLGRHTGHDPIDENEINFVRSAAVNIGVALENARLYQDAQETAEKLKEVDRLKSEFLANMSHELRTPLNSIIGFSRVILKGIDGPVTEMQQTDLQAIYDSGKHLLNLINDVLDLSKIEAGRMEFIFEPTDLHEVVSGVMSTAIALVKEKPIELQQDVPEELTPVVADERRIRQVILNLVGNASKFTEEGYIKVAAWREDEDVIVAVEDTGIGIPRDRYHSVFKEFEQVDSSSTRRYGGTGLGLPVSKKFVEAHGGEIWFESEVNVGTTFYVRLPIAGPSPEEPEEDETRADGEEALIVLTVDDDDGVITLFRRYLEKQGYRVMALTRGDRVVEEAKRIRPYAITLDIFLPDINGWEIVQALKSDPETRDIPIIVCSISNDRDKGLSMGVADYLVKPILEQDLLDALERVSDGGRPRDILVVDDTAEDRGLLRRILEGADYHVREATGGAEAIDLIHATPPELVVLDLMMPDVDGFAVLEELKSDATTRDIPVVVVTAKELTAAERALLTLRVESLLEKGIFDQENLLEDVGAALARLSEG